LQLRIRPEELRRRRLLKALEQEELAQRAGVSASSISRIENGDRGTTPATIRALAEALGCRPDDISDLVEEATA
jgi:transcriptional regulator with XRE-family HTH domain